MSDWPLVNVLPENWVRPTPGTAPWPSVLDTPKCPDDPWTLWYIDADLRPGFLEIPGECTEVEAVTLAQNHLLRHGRLHAEVEVSDGS